MVGEVSAGRLRWLGGPALPALPRLERAGADVLIEPAPERVSSVPGAGDVVEGIVASDTGLTGHQASDEERPELQQRISRVIAWISARRRREAITDEFEAGFLHREECCGQACTELLIGDGVAVPAQLIRCEAVVSRARVEATRGDIGVQPSAHRRIECKHATKRDSLFHPSR